MPTPTAKGFTPTGPLEPGSSAEVREHLVEALNLDLIGPWAGHAHAGERPAQRPAVACGPRPAAK